MFQAFTLVDIYLKEGKFSNENQVSVIQLKLVNVKNRLFSQKLRKTIVQKNGDFKLQRTFIAFNENFGKILSSSNRIRGYLS